MAQQISLDPKAAASQVVGVLQWVLATFCSLAIIILIAASLAARFKLPTFGIVALSPLDLVYYAIAYAAATGLLNGLFRK